MQTQTKAQLESTIVSLKNALWYASRNEAPRLQAMLLEKQNALEALQKAQISTFATEMGQ